MREQDLIRRDLEAAAMRERAFDAVIANLRVGVIRQEQAVRALRRAYHRAELHARGMKELVDAETLRHAAALMEEAHAGHHHTERNHRPSGRAPGTRQSAAP